MPSPSASGTAVSSTLALVRVPVLLAALSMIFRVQVPPPFFAPNTVFSVTLPPPEFEAK